MLFQMQNRRFQRKHINGKIKLIFFWSEINISNFSPN